MRQVIQRPALALLLMLGLASCEREGPMEETGEEIDDAAEEVRDRAEEVAG